MKFSLRKTHLVDALRYRYLTSLLVKKIYVSSTMDFSLYDYRIAP